MNTKKKLLSVAIFAAMICSSVCVTGCSTENSGSSDASTTAPADTTAPTDESDEPTEETSTNTDDFIGGSGEIEEPQGSDPMSCVLAPEGAVADFNEGTEYGSAFVFTALRGLDGVRIGTLEYDGETDTLSWGETLCEKGDMAAGDSFCARLETGEVIPTKAIAFSSGDTEQVYSIMISGRDGSTVLSELTLSERETPTGSLSCALAAQGAATDYDEGTEYGSAFVFTALRGLDNVRIGTLEYDGETDTLSWGETLCEKGDMAAGDSFCARLETGEVIPTKAIAFSSGGTEQVYSIMISGRDGSTVLSEVKLA